MSNHSHHSHYCGCCTSHCSASNISRRSFMGGVSATVASSLAYTTLSAHSASNDPVRFSPVRKSLRVQPVLIYSTPEPREGVSWRSWGSIQTEQDAADERRRIESELAALKKKAGFPLDVKPLIALKTPEEAKKVSNGDHDVLLMYPAGGWVNILEELTNPEKWTIVFLRHRSGPVYLWYEIVSNRFLRKTVDEFGQPGVDTKDVVVDRTDEVLWRLRALSGLKNTMGKRMVCVGGASGWGHGGQKAPELTRRRFGMELIDVSYDDLAVRIKKAQANKTLVKWCNEQADAYLKMEGTTLETGRDFVQRCFFLNEVFHELLHEYQTDAITINLCMGTIMQVSGTTACLPLSLLNDEGYLAFCESDFVVIPSGVLLHYISGKPVFLQDPTYPHDGIVTLAHCTAPRKMDGETIEPAKIMTHFESDWGAAPKVEMALGQKVTVIDPDFNFERWLGFEAEIVDNPFLDICRSQIDVEFSCDTDTLNEQTTGFHWMLSYGNYLKECEYAIRKAGMQWTTLS